MSTTQSEAVSIWLDRNAEPTDWSGRSAVAMEPDGDTVVLTWTEWDWDSHEVERRHVFHGTITALTEQIGDIRAGG